MYFSLMTYIGHGPFSHMFDKRFIPEARRGIPEARRGTKWKVLYVGNDFFVAVC